MLDVVTQWVAHYGFVIVAVFLFLESAGVPAPGETALVTAAALAGRGTLSIFAVILAGCVGTVAGGHAGYWLGAREGRALIDRYGKWVRLTPDRMARTEAVFARHGGKTIFLGRFVAFMRSFAGIFAGIVGMPLRTFAVYNATGGVVWVVTFSAIGYLFGRNLPRLVRYVGRASLIIAILVALVVGVIFAWRWFERNRTKVVASMDESFARATTTPRVSHWRQTHPRAWHYMSGSFAKGEYLAIHLLVGFLVSLTVIGLFATITEGLVDTSPLTRFDVTVAGRLEQSAAASLLRLFRVLSALGGRGAMTLFLIAGGLYYAVRRKGLELAGWCAAFIGGSILDVSLRFVVRRSELPFADVVLIDWGTGLVSRKALGVLVGYGMVGYLLASHARGALLRTAISVLAIAMIVAITVSRLFLGQQYISDTSAGLAAGLVWLVTCVTGVEIARQRKWGR
jgi:membrane protein DedA with SNARE-associated domain